MKPISRMTHAPCWLFCPTISMGLVSVVESESMRRVAADSLCVRCGVSLKSLAPSALQQNDTTMRTTLRVLRECGASVAHRPEPKVLVLVSRMKAARALWPSKGIFPQESPSAGAPSAALSSRKSSKKDCSGVSELSWSKGPSVFGPSKNGRKHASSSWKFAFARIWGDPLRFVRRAPVRLLNE
jgi:hypothetical protein